jgi:hypothetical protein
MMKHFSAVRSVFRAFCAFAPGAAAAFARNWALSHPSWIEIHYSRGIFRIISSFMGHISGMLPFSLGEWILIISFLGCLFLFPWLCLRHIRRRTSASSAGCGGASGGGVRRRVRIRNAFRLTGIGVFCAGCVCLFFLLSWGLNYQRAPLSESMGLELPTASEDLSAELSSLCHALAQKASLLAESSETAPDSRTKPSDFLGMAYLAYENLGRQWTFLAAGRPNVKSVYLSKAMSWMGISGVYLFFTAEANVNTDQPSFMWASSACHEIAHQIGFAREDEANYLAWLACARHPSPAYQYSGTLLALIHASNALAAADRDAYLDLTAGYTPKLRQDLNGLNAYWAGHKGFWNRLVTSVNDLYLKGNHQAAGVASYGRMVYLLLAEARQGSLSMIPAV